MLALFVWIVFQLFPPFLLVCFVASLLLIVLSDCDLTLSFYARWMKNFDRLRGKVVWITGASSGIGEELAYCLAGLGAKLVLSARRTEELERVLEKCKSLSPPDFKESHTVIPLDLLEYGSHSTLTQKVLEEYEKIDFLVNNAGRSQRGGALDTELAVEQTLLQLNTVGTISLTKSVLPFMVKQGSGSIIVISSVAGKIGAPGSSGYSASKHALQGYFDTLRMELSGTGVSVTSVCPGPIVSEFDRLILGESLESRPSIKFPKNNSSRMSKQRCCFLIAVAMANQLSEVWISLQPILLFTYVAQYAPTFGKWIGVKIGKRRLLAIKAGADEIDGSLISWVKR